MPGDGGHAGKLGDYYEGLWTIDQLLDVVAGNLTSITVESFVPEESIGIEFSTEDHRGIATFWSVKRQTSKPSGWTAALLLRKEANGRSIFSDLVSHVERDARHRAVFATTANAIELDELCRAAGSTTSLLSRLEQSQALKSAFETRILPVFNGEFDRACGVLRRMRVASSGEEELKRNVARQIQALLHGDGGGDVDVAAVRTHLGDFIASRYGQRIMREETISYLKEQGVHLRDWGRDSPVSARVAELNDNYRRPIDEQTINGEFLSVPSSPALLDENGRLAAKGTLLIGGAGGGKSTTLAHLVESLLVKKVPVLALRLDRPYEGIVTTTELGRKLLLPESPVVTLAGLAQGGPSVLVVDQLDAISTVSGRRSELWPVFDSLVQEVMKRPNMSVVVGCREFDLEHDHRMRQLKKDGSGFRLVRLQNLLDEQVQSAIVKSGSDVGTLSNGLKGILRVPLHLSMFLAIAPDHRTGVESLNALFESFWADKRQRVKERLGRASKWDVVIDRVCDHLSENQTLAAPYRILEDLDLDDDVEALISEHVLIRTDREVSFFHESFFDYAFARGFARHSGDLLALLLSGEQHLFRRAQVRQVLSHLLHTDRGRLRKEVGALLGHPEVRFHIKRTVLQWHLSDQVVPTAEDWRVLRKLADDDVHLRPFILALPRRSEAWFAIADDAGFFREGLESETPARVEEVIVTFATDTVLTRYSDRVAAYLKHYRRDDSNWKNYLRHICQFGEIFHSVPMFELFLSLVDDGTLDSEPPSAGQSDRWWLILHKVTEKKPELACEALAHWLDRKMVLARQEAASETHYPWSKDRLFHEFRTALNWATDFGQMVLATAKAGNAYVERIMPRLASLCVEAATPREGRLDRDPIWGFREYKERHIDVAQALVEGLVVALSAIAARSADEFRAHVAPYLSTRSETLSYVLLAAMATSPEALANDIASLLAGNPGRLEIGYISPRSKPSDAVYASFQALRAAAPYFSEEAFEKVEHAVMELTDGIDEEESRYAEQKQLILLEGMPAVRLSAGAKARCDRLRTRYPNVVVTEPESSELREVDVPISPEAADTMSDDEWLAAMRRYEGKEFGANGWDEGWGGEHEMANKVRERATKETSRFLKLATRLPSDLSFSYTEAILDALWISQRGSPPEQMRSVTVENLTSVLMRAHEFPDKPCGRSICRTVERWGHLDWPSEIAKVVAWYAIHDPDPKSEPKQFQGSGPRRRPEETLLHEGTKCTRGIATEAMSALLFKSDRYWADLESAVKSACLDPTSAVRCMAIGALVALLKSDAATATSLLKMTIENRPELLEVRYLERFVYYTGHRDYTAIRSVLFEMLESRREEAVDAASRVVVLLSLGIEIPDGDREAVEAGSPAMRMAAAGIYAINIANPEVGEECRRSITRFLADADAGVRTAAGAAMNRLAKLTVPAQEQLLRAFLANDPTPEALERALRVIEDSPVQLLELVCKLCELCMKHFGPEAGDVRKHGALVGHDLSKVVIRLYAQSVDPDIQRRCLDLIDEMERYAVYGVAEELARLER